MKSANDYGFDDDGEPGTWNFGFRVLGCGASPEPLNHQMVSIRVSGITSEINLSFWDFAHQAHDYAFDEDREPGNLNRKPGHTNWFPNWHPKPSTRNPKPQT